MARVPRRSRIQLVFSFDHGALTGSFSVHSCSALSALKKTFCQILFFTVHVTHRSPRMHQTKVWGDWEWELRLARPRARTLPFDIARQMGFGHQGSDRTGADSRCLVCQWRSIHGSCSSGASAGLPKILSAACSLTSNPHPHVCLSLLGLSNARRMHSRTGPRYGV